MASITTLFRKSVMPLAIAVTASCSSCEKKPTPEPQPSFPATVVSDVEVISCDRIAGTFGSGVAVDFNYSGKLYEMRNSYSGGGNANAIFSFEKVDLTDANTIIAIKYDQHGGGYLEVTNMPANSIALEFKGNAKTDHTYGAKNIDLTVTPQTRLVIAFVDEAEVKTMERKNRDELEEFADNFIEANFNSTGKREMITSLSLR